MADLDLLFGTKTTAFGSRDKESERMILNQQLVK
jgi:hypothetical protein